MQPTREGCGYWNDISWGDAIHTATTNAGAGDVRRPGPLRSWAAPGLRPAPGG